MPPNNKNRPNQIQRSSATFPIELPPWVTETAPGTFSIDAWGMEAPALEYVADGCEIQRICGLPVIYFWQQGPSGDPLSVVAISMAPGELKNVIESFGEIKKHLAEKLSVWHENTVVLEGNLSQIPPERHRRFMANCVRAASSEHSAMLDFYNVELYTLQRHKVTKGHVPPQVRDLLRIWAAPPVLARMLNLLENH